MDKKLGIPYMGSKRKLACTIIDYILQQNPNCKYFYDLFGGGGAISFEALQREQIKQVYYNELNTGVVELLKKIREEGVTKDFYNWVDRETFNKHKNDNTWFGGLLKTCWSFGNNQKDYLFGKDVEPIKKEAHEYLFENGYDFTSETRIKLLKRFKQDKNIKNRFELEQLQRLEQLEQLQQLERLQRLVISNLSYEQVVIDTPIDETIIYLDPPYKNTKKYEIDVCHNAVHSYITNSKYKIYASSYDWEGLNEVMSIEHISTLCATNNSKKVQEKLFCNRTDIKLDLFMGL